MRSARLCFYLGQIHRTYGVKKKEDTSMRYPRRTIKIACLVLVGALLAPATARAAQASWQEEWSRTIEAAKKEGKVVVSIPASVDLRKGLEEGFGRRFPGVKLEMFAARGGEAIRRIVDEYKAGVHYFDVHVGGTTSIVMEILPENMLEPVEPYFLLPEVKDAKKNWWAGHMWIDKAHKYVYGFQAYTFANVWYNSTLLNPDEVRSYDDFLNPKWKGKIGLLDPRTPGAGDATWSYIYMVKGEEFLKKLAAQKLLLDRNQRQLAEALAQGKIALSLGLTEYSFLPFMQAGLPVKPLPTPREGTYTTGGSGHLTIIKNSPHPNATKVFVNWLLSKEGQEIFTKTLGQGTRRLDVDTKWLNKELGVMAAKDFLTPEQFFARENQSEERVEKVRRPAIEMSEKLFQ
jgi:iron(III) transport system substrate-binding protein